MMGEKSFPKQRSVIKPRFIIILESFYAANEKELYKMALFAKKYYNLGFIVLISTVFS